MSFGSDIYLPVNQIFISNRRRFLTKAYDKKKEYLGVDTETYKGKCILIANSDYKEVHTDDYINKEPKFFLKILQFLMYKNNKPLYRAFWNIEFDVSAIVKKSPLTADDIWDLYHGIKIMVCPSCAKRFTKNIKRKYKTKEGKKASSLRCKCGFSGEYENFYKLQYFQRAMFQISKDHDTVHYTDLFQIYTCSLSHASEEYLNKKKYEKINSKRLNTEIDYWKDNLDDIIYYCKIDAVLTKELGDLFLANVKKTYLKLPKYIVSFASLTKQNFRYFCRIPNISHIPTPILDIAQTTYFAHRVEILKRGSFDNAYYYDINSAFPDRIKDIPSFKYGKWKKVDTINDKETIGFYKVFVDIPEDIYISPLPYKNPSNKLCIFPYGTFGRWITWYEADLLRDYIYKKNPILGFEYVPGAGEYKPFERITNGLYSKKAYYKKTKQDLKKDIMKKTLVALYGTFAEKHEIPDKDGDENNKVYNGGVLFNPVCASIIPAHCRWRLLKSIREKDYENIIGFHADSILSTKKLNLPLSDKMGDWELEKSGKTTIINTGRYQVEDVVKHRGFESKQENQIDWFTLLEQNLDNNKIEMPYEHCMTMKESLLRHYDDREVNIFIEDYRHLDINADKKRKWDRDFRDCRDLMNSNVDSKPRKRAVYFKKDFSFKYYNLNEKRVVDFLKDSERI